MWVDRVMSLSMIKKKPDANCKYVVLNAALISVVND